MYLQVAVRIGVRGQAQGEGEQQALHGQRHNLVQRVIEYG